MECTLVIIAVYLVVALMLVFMMDTWEVVTYLERKTNFDNVVYIAFYPALRVRVWFMKLGKKLGKWFEQDR